MSTGELAAHAAAALVRMESRDEELLPIIQRQLARFEERDAWATPVVQRAVELYEDLSGYPAGTEFRNRVRQTLLKTRNPDDTPGNTAERLTKWLSTYIENAAEYVAGDSGSEKTWITQHDDRVRSAHAALDGKTVLSSERFDVGTAKLRFPGEPVGDPAGWINCRCSMRVTKGAEMAEKTETLIADVGPHRDAENEPPVAADPADLPAENPDEPEIDQDTQVPFHGVATVTDRPTGDRRQLASTGYSARPLPLPVFYQRAQSEGHGGSTIVGQFTRIELNEAGEVEYDGHFNYTPEAGEAIQGIAEGWLRGVSVDLDDILVDYSRPSVMDQINGDEEVDPDELMDAMQQEIQVFSQWRVAGLTIVGIPAFHEAYIALGPRPAPAEEQVPHEEDGDGIHDGETVPRSQAGYAAATETFAPGTHDGPGWITNPVPTGRIRRYWTQGEGAAKIKWGVPGDFNRCREQIAKYIANPEWLAGTCANMHKEAIGVWPGQEDGSHAIRNSLVASGAKMAAAFNLVASAAPEELPPSAWFANPELTAPTPITIEGDRIFGHIAAWGTCHIGFGGTCTEAPRSATDYSWFRLGAIETSEGLVPVGQITLGTGHADLRGNQRVAAAHYDNTGTAVADIATGEDEHGIWFAGAIRPDTTATQRRELLGAKLSGDWREVRGNLELVAALAVNTPGFGIPRLGLAASGVEQTALVAAGIVEAPAVVQEAEPELVGVSAAFLARVERLEQAERQRALRSIDLTGLRKAVADRRAARLAAVKSKLGR